MKNTITIIITIFLSLNITAQINFGKNIIEGKFSSALGTENVSNGFTSFTTGMGCSAQGDYSFVSGWNINLDGIASFSLGYGNNVNASGAAALGTISSAMGTGAFAIGNKVDALFPYSIAIGKGHSSGHLKNNISSSLMIGFESDIPTFFVGPAYGTGTVGKVGIGTTDPGSRLQVNGNMAVGYESNSSAPDNGMVVKGTSGIGTSNPDKSKLHVYRNNTIGGIGSANIDHSTLRIEDQYNNLYIDGNSFFTTGSGAMLFATLNEKNIAFGTNNTMRVKIQTDDEVHFYGNRKIEVNSRVGIVDINASSGGWAMGLNFIGYDGTSHGGWKAFGSRDELNYYYVGSSYSNPLMAVLPSGNVGIGTTNTFGYKLAVNGTIGCKEVIIEVDNNWPDWPDYVFEEGHELQGLEEIEQFVTQNKHLPGVPSANEVNENGIELGKMNAILLKKIEELTLHTINQQKAIRNLQEELQELKNNQ